jgi:hypothetical protein
VPPLTVSLVQADFCMNRDRTGLPFHQNQWKLLAVAFQLSTYLNL